MLQCPQKDGTSAQTVCGDVHWRLTAENVARGDEVRCSECFKLELGKERMEREMARLEESDEQDADLDLRQKRAEYEFFMGVMAGGERELRDLFDIYEGMEHFTREQIDTNQQEYWEARMTRQTRMQIMAGGVQWAQLDAMRQVGLLDDLVDERETALAEMNGQVEICAT